MAEQDGSELHESEARMRLLIESVRDYAIFMLDPTGHIATWNPGAEQIKGYSAKEIIGKHFSIFYPEAETAIGKCAYELRVARSVGRFEEEAWRIRKDGTRFWANVVISAVRDSQGQLVGFAKVTRDLTERKRAEEERAALAVAEQANRAKDEFLAMLSHELRNPLAPIVTAIQVIRMREGANIPPELGIIERQVAHVVRLVDDLLDIARIKQGKVELRHVPIEVWEAVFKAIEIASPLLEQRRHRLKVEVPRHGLVVEADVVRLAQVFTNLVTNAAKYTPAGGEIVVTARRAGTKVEVCVSDNGVGIRPEMLAKIFDLFEQGERAADRAEGGLGIGLTLARSLVSLHGGSIIAHSEGPGKGTTITVELPLSSASTGTAVVAPAPEPQASRSKRILLVDDNDDAAGLLGELLRRVGHDVRVAHDGPAALTIVHDFDPDVAILDIGLPVMDGYDLAMRLRQLLGPRLRLVALTGYGRERDRDRSTLAGFSRHLVKPVDHHLLLEVIADD